MKKLILSTLLAVGFAGSVFAQGAAFFDMSNNTSQSPTATTGGLWFVSTGGNTSLLNVDVNAVLYGSATQTGTFAPLATLLLSNGTASGDITFFGAGQFQDQSGVPYSVTGAGTSAFFYIQAWEGNFNTLSAAELAGVPVYDGSVNGIFSNPTAVSPAPAPAMTGNPAIVLAVVPEPGTFALLGLGASALLIFRRRK